MMMEANLPLELCVSCPSQAMLDQSCIMIRTLLDGCAHQYDQFCIQNGVEVILHTLHTMLPDAQAKSEKMNRQERLRSDHAVASTTHDQAANVARK